ncbi:anhydro-N-acetylmuramic acid kinase [Ectothiorhodospira mobilis]|uniref:anhydro-N-acetylmuramic acid kinase n=1 Tax=Ectothiorhodospira mobilis TaxID=195064 RepID=UPI001903AE6D|nr:anhydro-N-acetylmuramic acid kinase [Ectothiorhodospira mobilis]MBK1692189.1 anhydro-N-acetylmuramic acid kinase [Ectothiorhodospira mobilis]
MNPRFIGLLSGTSMDAVDAALVSFEDAGPQCLATHSHAIPEDLRRELRALAAPGARSDPDTWGRLDARTGDLMAAAVQGLLETHGIDPATVRAVGSHGQTLRHRPQEQPPFTLQIGCPHRIAQATGLTVVADFRRRDVAAGGQGAPLVPAFHRYALGAEEEPRVILNLGGIANVTLLPARQDEAQHGTPVRGFDTGPANTLCDAWIRACREDAFDAGGAWAAQGRVDEALLAAMLADPYFRQPFPKSTGTEHFHLEWVRGHLGGRSVAPVDVQRTLVELTARSVAMAVLETAPRGRRLLVCGGGVHNRCLMESLEANLPGWDVASTAVLGMPPDWVEAMAFAWLARETLAGRPGNLPAVTGAREAVVLGAIHPGRDGRI